MVKKVCIVALAWLLVGTSIASAEVASFYGDELRNSPMANGEPFVPELPSAAHRTYPFGTVLKVCYVSCENVEIKDRGPHIDGRDLDLSRGTAERIGLAPVGVDQVEVTLLHLP